MRVIESASFRYSPKHPWILRNASLEVDSQQSVAVLGPSGSGKTTVLALVGGLLSPNEGQVRHRWDVSWVFQGSNGFNNRTALDNVALGPICKGVGRSTALDRARVAIGSVELSHVMSYGFGSLSGGEKQRVCIARALAAGSQMILADEPTGQLDAETSKTVVEALMNATESSALVVATHDLSVANACDKVLELVNGSFELLETI